MRTFLIELFAKTIELMLLRATGSSGRPGGFCLERAMHPLVPAVLLRLARLDQLGKDAKSHPPSREAGQPRKRLCCEGHAVVGTDAARHPVFLEEPREDRLALDQCLAS